MENESWIVYLARPLDAVLLGVDENENGHGLGSRLTTILLDLGEAGAKVYDPGAFSMEPDGNPFIQHVHNAALKHCDAVLAWLPDGLPSIGVPLEIARAVELKKPLVVVGGQHAAGSAPLAEREVPVFERSDEAVQMLAALTIQEAAQPMLDDMAAIYLSGLMKEETEPDWPNHGVAMFCGYVRTEAARARVKHPRSDDEDYTTVERWFSIWAEEVWEAMAAWNDRKSRDEIRAELVQVGAMTARLWLSVSRVLSE